MKNSIIGSLFTAVILTMCNAEPNTTASTEEIAKNRAAIDSFYHHALTVNEDCRPTAVLSSLLAEGYQSYATKGTKNAAQLSQQLEFFWKIVPDLKWAPQQVTRDGDVYTVRSVASGTPNGDFMGMPTNGTKSFNIVTIDMHTIKDGRIIETHHVEDWATAMRQLKPETPATSSPTEGEMTMKIASAYMNAMSSGNMEAMKNLMHDDMVWQNEGDKSMPWIGPWVGKQVILSDFFPKFGENFKTLEWKTEDTLAKGDTAAFFGKMTGLTTHSNQKTNEFTFGLRVKVKDGKVILWNWLENSYEVSKTYHKGQ